MKKLTIVTLVSLILSSCSQTANNISNTDSMNRHIAQAQADSSATTSTNSIDTMSSALADTVQKLQAAQLWIGGSVTVTNGVQSKTSIYGTRETTKPAVPTSTSHFEIGSISKSFTGILLEWLIATHSSVHMDEPIENFLPELSGHFSGKITLRQLATHTSGLPDAACISKTTTNAGYCPSPKDPSNPWADTNAEQIIKFLTLFDRSGTGPFPSVYSNVGFITIGYIISQITGKSYSELISEVISKPLQMNDTVVNLPGLSISDYVPGHDVTQQRTEHWKFTEVSAPAGGIVSTPNDMEKYLLANLRPSETVLGKAIQMSHKDGAGWDNPIGSASTYKNGGTGGFSSFIYLNPSSQTGAVVLSNSAPVYSASLAGYPIFWPSYFGQSNTFPDLMGVSLSQSVLASYAGTYTTDDVDNFPCRVTIKPSGSLLWFLCGKPGSGVNLRLEALSTTLFAGTDGDHVIGSWLVTFQTDGNGKTNGFIFKFNDGSGDAPDTFIKVK